MSTTKTDAVAEQIESQAIEAMSAGLPPIFKFGNYPSLAVFVDRTVFAVTPGADGVIIATRSEEIWAKAYALDVQNSLNEWRRRENDSVIFHKLGGGARPSLASLIIESIIESQTRRAMGVSHR
jgi:hypothetical protein